jgi:hypothetical protein
MDKVIIFHEKHGDRFYDASTDEKLLAALFSVMIDRIEDGYWYREPSLEDFINRRLTEEDRELMEIDKEIVAKLPQSFQDRYQELHTRRDRARKAYEAEKEWWDTLQEIQSLSFEEAAEKVRTRPSRLNPGRILRTPTILWVMEWRKDYQYEGWTIQEILTP